MKIIVLDGYTENPGDLSWAPLEELGDLTVYDRTDPSDQELIIQRIGDAQAVFSNKTPITASIMHACPQLRFIGMLATGYNMIDVQAAAQAGITVCNVPSYGTEAVAQMAIALLLEITNQVGHHSQTVRQGKWSNHIDWCYWDYSLIELAGKTMGIIGFGRIGQRTGQIAKSMGMRILAYDTSPNETGRQIAEYVGLEELLAQSDVIALHCPLFAENEGLICKDTILQMKDGVIIINNSRGQLIKEQDLADALHSGKVFAAAVDVVSTEPIRKDNPLLTAPNCFITPHNSWSAKEARQRIMDTAAENLRAYLNGKPKNVVNL